MDIRKVKVGDLSKLAKLMKASGKPTNSKAISKAKKQAKELGKHSSGMKAMAKENPDV